MTKINEIDKMVGIPKRILQHVINVLQAIILYVRDLTNEKHNTTR